MGNSTNLQDPIKTKLYKWSSGEFREEYALIYTEGDKYPSTIVTFYYRVRRDKVVITMDHRSLLDNRIRLNVELAAVRDAERRFVFGPVKFKESVTTKFLERRRKANKNEVLFLKYTDSNWIRFNVLEFYKRKKIEEYDLVYDTGISRASSSSIDDYFEHTIKIHCDPSKGLHVNLCGPYRHYQSGEERLCETKHISRFPPEYVIDNDDVIRRDLNIEGGGGASQSIYNNKIINSGPIRGDGNGSIYN